MAGKDRLRAAQSRCNRRPVGAAAWAKGKPGMKTALLGVEPCRKPPGAGRGGRWPQPSAGKMPRLRAGYEAEGVLK